MKKTYLKPSMNVEMFEVMDVVMASGAEFDVNKFLGMLKTILHEK